MINKIVLIVAGCLLVGQANAERNELVLNLGLGYGINNQSVSTWDVESQPAASSDGLVARVNVGVMTTPVDALFVFGQASRLRYDNQEANIDTATLSLLGVGYTHYLESEIGSPFFSLGVALSRFDADNGNNPIVNSGQAFLLGTGYEVNSHLQLSSIFMMSRMTDRDWYDDDFVDVASTSVIFNIELKL